MGRTIVAKTFRSGAENAALYANSLMVWGFVDVQLLQDGDGIAVIARPDFSDINGALEYALKDVDRSFREDGGEY